MSGSIVLGCGYGDEGKGLTVHNLCRPTSLVVRFSGGQQAGHTVIHNGIKHIFSNFGSGTFKGCPTFFTEDTCIYPKTISVEWGALTSKGVNPTLYVHPLARVTTPFDVWAGRIQERRVRHGSCGLGIGTTMKRNEGPVKFYAVDLLGPPSFVSNKLRAVRDYYGFKETDLVSEDRARFLTDCEAFAEAIGNRRFQICRFGDLPSYSDLVFEGSQGILLDMDHGVFPNVTFANTTSKNAWKYIRGNVEIYYVTRCYHTRHGNGPFETSPISLVNTQEEINVPNDWQGEFRVGEINYGLLRHAISLDRFYHPRDEKSNLVVSCLDQRPDWKFDFAFMGEYFDEIYGNYSSQGGHLKKLDKGKTT